LLQQTPNVPGGYQFSHALVRDVLYRELGASRRASLHSRVAHDLQRRSGQLQDAHVEELAYHFGRAAFEARICVDETLSYAERAGERAFAGLAYEASAEHFAHALDLLALTELPDNRLRCSRSSPMCGQRWTCCLSTSSFGHSADSLSAGYAEERASSTAPPGAES